MPRIRQKGGKMKKKITLALLAVCCALCCAFGIVGCGNDDNNNVNGLLIAKTGETPKDTSKALLVQTTYGETPDLDYKLYASYKNGDKKEIALDDSKLKVEYSYYEYNSEGDVKIDELPEKMLAGQYSIRYFYDGNKDHKAVVNITVNRAESGAFVVQPQKSVLYTNEDVPSVTLKNHDGAVVQYADSLSDELNSDDSNGEYELRYVVKSIYDGFTSAQKTDYEFLYDNNSVRYFGQNTTFDTVGNYMLLGLVKKTHNYSHVVTPAVELTVSDAFIERTFTCQSVVLVDGDGDVVSDEDNEYVGMAQSFNEGNQGKTVILKTNGEVRGTVDFGGGEFNEMPDDEVYLYSRSNDKIFIDTQDGTRIGEGKKTGNTLVVKLSVSDDYYFLATFTG